MFAKSELSAKMRRGCKSLAARRATPIFAAPRFYRYTSPGTPDLLAQKNVRRNARFARQTVGAYYFPICETL
jgi:hypothetical protein